MADGGERGQWTEPERTSTSPRRAARSKRSAISLHSYGERIE